MRAITIEIFLPDGDPTGIKVAHIRNRNIDATYIPRAQFNNLKGRESLQGVGIYILAGEAEQHSKPKIYIGEAENVFNRIAQHNVNKDFWNYAIALTSNNKHLTKTHVKFLEWLCHSKASEANRSILENGNLPTKPHVQESTEADLLDNYESIEMLISTLGLNIFKPLTISITSQSSEENPHDVFEFKSITERSAQFEARGKYTGEGFVVFAGSKFAKPNTPSFIETTKRIKLLGDGILLDDGKCFLLKEDTLFNTPSGAADSVSGRSTSGWNVWKRKDGKTLDEIYRKVAT